MREPERKCTICRGLLDEEDLFCANCGAEAPRGAETEDTLSTRVSTHNFTCQGCGAAMSYDATAQTLRCPFCGSEQLEKQKDAKVVSPQLVVPFRVNDAAADKILREWLGKGFWRPGDLKDAAVVEKMMPVYVPYWSFRATTHTFWTADTSERPAFARGDWAPISGEHRAQHAGVLVGASGALAPAETSAICPFDLSAGVPPEKIDLERITVEQFSVPRKYARPLAQSGLEEIERQTVASKYVPGRSRNVHVNVLLDGLSSEPILLPVWIMAYRYKETVYRFLINGQTGATTGQKPVSYKKIAGAVGIGIAVLAAIIFALLICGGVGAAFSQISPRDAKVATTSIEPCKTSAKLTLRKLTADTRG